MVVAWVRLYLEIVRCGCTSSRSVAWGCQHSLISTQVLLFSMVVWKLVCLIDYMYTALVDH